LQLFNYFAAMNMLSELYKKLRGYVSPTYITMLFAAFVLWYIAKLGDTYTTEHEVVVFVDGERLDVDCVIRGKGTNLIGYTLFSSGDEFDIPSTELTFDMDGQDEEGNRIHHIATVSLQQALAARMTGVDIVSVGAIPPIPYNVVCE
jgi:hypothetical protein